MKTSSSEQLHGYIEQYIDCVQDAHHQQYRVFRKHAISISQMENGNMNTNNHPPI